MRNHYSNVFSFFIVCRLRHYYQRMRIIILFALCRYAHSCAFISVIKLPRIPAYCPKLKKQVAKFRETVYTKDRSKCLPLADGAGYK